MCSFKIIHSVLEKSELWTAMTVRMCPIYYNSSLFYLILILNKSGLYFKDQLLTSPDNNKKMGPWLPTVGKFSLKFKRGLSRIQIHRWIEHVKELSVN